MKTYDGGEVRNMTRRHLTAPLAILLVPSMDRGKEMTRRIQVGPVIVALAAIVLLVSLFLEWYGSLIAWEAFEIVDVLLAALALAALMAAVGTVAPDVAYVERRWLPPIALGAALVVAAELDPPPAAGPESAATGAWLAFGAALVMVVGAILSLGRVSVAVSVDRHETRERVPVVDHRQDTTETAPVTASESPRRTGG
jgi:hypothetical protein